MYRQRDINNQTTQNHIVQNLNRHQLSTRVGLNCHAAARRIALITLTLAFCGATKIQAQYQLSPLNYFASGINNSGTILADSGLGDMLLVNGDSVTSVSLPDGAFPTTYGVNAEGTIIGQAVADDSSTFAFVLTKQGKETHLTIPGALSVTPYGINTRGVVVGSYLDQDAATHGFIWDSNGPKVFDAPGASRTQLRGINASGTMVGSYTSNRIAHSFILAGSTFASLDLPGAVQSFATGINSRGQIVGSYTSAANRGLNLGYIYDNGAVTTVGSVFSNEEAPLSFQQPFDFGDGVSGTVTWVQRKNFTEVIGINDEGNIVGMSYVDYTAALVDCGGCGLTSDDFGDYLILENFTGMRGGFSVVHVKNTGNQNIQKIRLPRGTTAEDIQPLIHGLEP